MSKYSSQIETVDDTIADAGTTSGGAKVLGKNAIGVVVPSGVEGTNIDLEVTFDDGSNWHKITDNGGSAVQVQAANAGYNAFSLHDMEALEHVRLVADTAQTGSATFTWVFKP